MHDISSPPVEEQLRIALAGLVDGLPARQASTAVDRLIAHYRGTTPTHTPVLRDHADVVAYAAYRMPATFEAVASALAAFADRAPGWSPASHLDIGGGTGAAVWAASLVWGDGPGDGSGDERPVRRTTVLDWAPPALALGRELAGGSASASLRAARWQTGKLSATALAAAADTERAPAPAPPVELVTISYVLGELTPGDRRETVAAAALAGRAVVVVEPGTPDGYLRVREARDLLVDAGLTVLAPCPHSAACPLIPGEDWCHFAARVSRSSLHRQVKGGSLPYEDEKFSYVAAMRPGAVDGTPVGARIVRKPQLRKGLVLLDLCGADEMLRRTTVSKRHGVLYREARDAGWGDSWPPESGPDER